MKKIKTKRQRFRLSFPALLILIFCIVIVVISVVLQNNKSTYKSRAESIKSTNKILGGEPADPNEWDFMVVIISKATLDMERKRGIINQTYADVQLCGGILVAPEWILTAKHCVPEDMSIYMVVQEKPDLNLNDLVDDTKTINIIDVVYTQQAFTNDGYYNWNSDLALIKIAKALKAHFPQLPLESWDEEMRKEPVIIAGWGLTRADTTNGSEILLKADTTTLPFKEGIRKYLSNSLIYNELSTEDRNKYEERYTGIIFAGTEGTFNARNTCDGDSGGPLIYHINDRKIIVGVTSFGPDCVQSEPFQIGGYVNVSRHTKWIRGVISNITEYPNNPQDPR